MNALKRRSYTMKKRKRTDKSKYRHKSTGDYCTCAAYIAEIMCMRNAENKNQGSLPYKFWNKKPWNWTFQRQLIAANKILKNFSEAAVVKAIESKDFKGIFSLNHPNCVGIITKYQLLLDEQTEKRQDINVKKDGKHRKKGYGTKNVFNTLRNIEDAKEDEQDSV